MSSIIHFTKEYNVLRSILTDCSFTLKYCREVFYLADKISSNAVHPMVCFSEQIIKNIDKKNITYGKFGIGLSKEWSEKAKVHPVLYLDRNSHVANALSLLLKARRKNADVELAPDVRLSIMTIKCFTKNSIGYNSYFKMENFDFKSEKEWRYVPTKTDIDNNLISRNKKQYDRNPKLYNDKIRKFPLKFSTNDIEYLFVETEEQRREISKEFGINMNIIKISKWTTQLKKAKAPRGNGL
ncbi:abortive infection system antitoxin AbiGi family protein [Pedobacter sp.]|uniref:abortive infection system antitoxin AbiGi family protein n=1 Tax=Pedobacter sp. TaxID=1411316 RepID=UPI0031DCDC24